MKNLKGLLVVVAALVLCSCSGGCSAQNQIQEENQSGGGTHLSVVNWNLQTFFDAKKDGCEYKEFQKSSDWNTQTYKARLERLCSFITQLNADIYVFEEIENEGIIYDISNQLSGDGHNWNQRKFWNYSVFAKEEGTAIGIGILSRYPLDNIKTHSMDIRLHNTAQPSMRYILEAEVSVEKNKLVLLANHWKSKSGGEQETEIWRDWQESILGNRVAELVQQEDASIVICGDFNRDAGDFIPGENTLLRYAGFGYTENISVNSLWFTDYGDFVSQKGSYRYDNAWERIDNIMIAGAVKNVAFSPVTTGAWATEEGYPVAYKIYSGQGWSDHLPVYAELVFYSD